MDVRNRVLEIIKKYNVFETNIKNDTLLNSNIGIDSLDFLNLINDVEEHFQIEIALEEMKQCVLFEALVHIVEIKLKSGD